MAIIYRVEKVRENGERVGPYRGSDLAYYAGLDSLVTDRHPSPYQDPHLSEWLDKTSIADEYYCCFTTLDQYLSWFHKENGRQAMSHHGGVVAVYEVNDEWLEVGAVQSLVRLESAVHLYDLHTGTLEKLRG